MRQMNQQEQEFLDIAHDMCAVIWNTHYSILGIKINSMRNYCGWAIPDDTNKGFHILLSLVENKNQREFVGTLAHELIHIHLWHGSEKHQAKAHKHGKLFRKIAKRIVRMSNGYLRMKDIV